MIFPIFFCLNDPSITTNCAKKDKKRERVSCYTYTTRNHGNICQNVKSFQIVIFTESKKKTDHFVQYKISTLNNCFFVSSVLFLCFSFFFGICCVFRHLTFRTKGGSVFESFLFARDGYVNRKLVKHGVPVERVVFVVCFLWMLVAWMKIIGCVSERSSPLCLRNQVRLRVYSHLRFITRLRLWLPLGLIMGCASIFAIAIHFHSTRKNYNSNCNRNSNTVLKHFHTL